VSERQRQRNRKLRRRAFHIAIALILVICALSPFLESAVNWNDSVFATGYDGESTLAVLVLLLELVISFSGVLVYLSATAESGERIAARRWLVRPAYAAFRISLPELSPPPPLRI
jgi:hypothetical protein